MPFGALKSFGSVSCAGWLSVVFSGWIEISLLGLNPGHVPHHVKAYANLKDTVTKAVAQFRDEVRQGEFPGEEHAFS